jgi:hypothetical protein
MCGRDSVTQRVQEVSRATRVGKKKPTTMDPNSEWRMVNGK